MFVLQFLTIILIQIQIRQTIFGIRSPVAIWRDKLDDTNEAASYFSMRAYQYSKDSADGPSAVGKGSWQLEEDTA